MKISVKQLEIFGTKSRRAGALNGCPRKYVGQYLDRWPQGPKSQAMQLGIDFHVACEALCKTGRLPPEFPPESNVGRMARAAFALKPVVRGTVWTAEQEGLVIPWTTVTGERCELEFNPDLWNGAPPPVDPLRVVDWKSCASGRFSLKTIENDVEARVYAGAAMTITGKHTCENRWAYVNKHDYSAWPIDHIFGFKETIEWMHEELDGTIDLLHMIWRMRPSALEVPQDIEACEGVGKQCDFVSLCMPELERETLISLNDIRRVKGSIEHAE